MVTTCTICDNPISSCPHTDDERKKHEIAIAWESHKAADPEAMEQIHDAQKEDEDRGAYERVYRKG